MEKRIKTKKLSDGTLQIGYNNAQGWVGLANIYRLHRNHGVGWKSDNWPGVEKTITAWKERIQGYVNQDAGL